MGFMAGVWRMLGADEEESAAVQEQRIVEYPAPQRQSAAPALLTAQEPVPDQAAPPVDKTIFVVRPELDDSGEAAFSLKEYASFLLTEQALVLDVNIVAGEDELHAMRIVDYLSGVAEAIGGSVFEVTKNIFIFTPASLQLAGDPVTQIEVN